MTKVIPPLITMLALASCSAPYRPDPAKAALISATKITCTEKVDCDIKWSAALRWVTQNSGYKLRVISASHIETYGPLNSSPLLAVSVSMFRVSGNTSQIVPTITCDNRYGCEPDAQDAMIDFMRTVQASAK